MRLRKGRSVRVEEGEGEGEGEWVRRTLHPVPFFPLRRMILAQGGSLLVSVCLVLVVLATCFCWPTYPSLSVCPEHSCMLFDGMLA